jgi:toxin ParE1/3/4
MSRYRLSDVAKADIAAALRTSETIHGADARVRYRALLTAAMRRIAAEPLGACPGNGHGIKRSEF